MATGFKTDTNWNAPQNVSYFPQTLKIPPAQYARDLKMSNLVTGGVQSFVLDIVPFSHLVDHCSGIPDAGTEELLAESSRTSDKGNFSTSSTSDATPTIIEDDVDSNEGNVSSGEIITLDIQEVTIQYSKVG